MVRSEWRQLDLLLFLFMALLIAYGLAMIYSATFELQGTSEVDERVYRQSIYAGIGFVLLIVIVWMDYRLLGNAAIPIYFLAIALLVAVLIIGQVTHGAQRWINLGFLPLQPSEPVKLLVIVGLAKFLADREEDMHKFRYVLVSLGIALIPTVLTFVQPDLATAIVFLAVWAGMLIVAGARWWHFIVIAVAGVGSIPVVWNVLQPYMRDRILIFLGITGDPQGVAYGSQQAIIGIGAGGLFGQGFTSGSQSQLHFLQVQYADFIFSVMAEEMGFVGVMALFILFWGLVLRTVRVASLAGDGFGRLIATGIAVMLTFEIFVNVGMNIGLLPVAGIPLPFVSYGGSALVTAIAAVGLLQNIVMRRKRPV